MEEWRQSKDMKNYEVSNEGRVRNSKTGRIMRTHFNEKGYEVLALRDGGRQHSKRVHRLVAEAFNDRSDEGLEVTHRDKNRANNRLDNLEWKTRADILKQTYEEGRRQTHRMKKIMCVETGEEYDSIADCSDDMKINRQSISRCVNNPVLTTREGYHFRPVD